MQAHTQASPTATIINATMDHVQHNATFATHTDGLVIQISDMAMAVALPYSDTPSSHAFGTLLTRHPHYSTAVNICFLVLVLAWAFWEKITGVVEAFDNWLIDETIKEDHRVFMESYCRKRRNLRVVGILKEKRLEENAMGVQFENVERLARPGFMAKRVSFGVEVKDFDGEREEQCIQVVVPALAK